MGILALENTVSEVENQTDSKTGWTHPKSGWEHSGTSQQTISKLNHREKKTEHKRNGGHREKF